VIVLPLRLSSAHAAPAGLCEIIKVPILLDVGLLKVGVNNTHLALRFFYVDLAYGLLTRMALLVVVWVVSKDETPSLVLCKIFLHTYSFKQCKDVNL
jgi:hypothetical protein